MTDYKPDPDITLEALKRHLSPEWVAPSKGNVFEQIGLENAEELSNKARLARAIRKVIETEGWNQEAAGQALGLTQSNVSQLLNGKLDRFSVEKLEKLLSRLGTVMLVFVRESPKYEKIEEHICLFEDA